MSEVSADDAVAHLAEPGLPWCVVGKGPSLDLHAALDLSQYRLLTLNDACTVVPPDVAHFTDLEALRRCEYRLEDPGPRLQYLCLPWHPHADNRPHHRDLLAWAEEYPVIREYGATDRLLSYNSSLADRLPRKKGLRDVRVRFFSAVAALNLVAASGQKKLYSLGVDGGDGYAVCVSQEGRLANGRESFDVQFAEIEATCRRYRASHVRLRPQPARA